jgi:DNA polymerase III subunit gamma/tau
MFYLEYRPQKFSDLIKPNPVAEALSKQSKEGNLSHAYLLIGPRGTGKTTVARLIAKAANCLDLGSDGDPCGECANCKAIQKGGFLDLIEIDAASNRGIDDIRSLRDRVGLAPSQGTAKVYIIDEVHMLTNEAFNALLKTLEEPPSHAIFVLCTTEPSKVLDTIKSRCQVFNFRRATVEQLVSKLREIATDQKAEVSDQVLQKIAKASFGGYRDAETMLQQVLQGGLDPEALLEAGSYAGFISFTEYLLEGALGPALSHLEEVYAKGTDLQVWNSSLLDYFKALLFVKAGVGDFTDDVTDEVAAQMEVQASRLSVNQLVFLAGRFLDAHVRVGDSGMSLLPLELATAEVCSSGGGGGDVAGGDSGGSGKPAAPKKLSKDLPKTKTKSEAVGPEKEESAEEVVAKAREVTKKEKAAEGSEKLEEKEPPEAVKEEKEKEKEGPVISVEDISKSWNQVLRQSTKYNHSVRALLKATSPVEVVGNCLTLEVRFAFHKDRLEYSKNREIAERVFLEVFEVPLTFSCKLKEKKTPKKASRETGNLTDFNVVVPSTSSSVEIDDSLLDVFDGSLPL